MTEKKKSKEEVLRSSRAKVKERDKTPGSDVQYQLSRATQEWARQYEDFELDTMERMYNESDLKTVASKVALELLWTWINETRFDGKHSNDLMMMARGAFKVPGQHQLDCMGLTEMSSGIDVMAGAIRHQLSRIWGFAHTNFETSIEVEEVEEEVEND